MSDLNSKLEYIGILKARNKVFPITKLFSRQNQDYKFRHGYKGIEFEDLVMEGLFDDFEIITWQLVKGELKEFERVYNEYDITEVFRLYTLKIAIDFEEPPPIKD